MPSHCPSTLGFLIIRAAHVPSFFPLVLSPIHKNYKVAKIPFLFPVALGPLHALPKYIHALKVLHIYNIILGPRNVHHKQLKHY